MKFKQNNLGFSLVEVIVALAITTIVFLGISTFYTFYHKQQILATKTQNISSIINLLKNTLISDYKYHRGDNPPLLNAVGTVINANFRPNINRVRIDETGLFKRSIHNINIGQYNLSLLLPMTQQDMEANSDGKQVEYSNTKFLTIEQLVKQNDGEPRIRRIEYRMRCQTLPPAIKDRLDKYKVNLIDLLNEVNFFESTKCMKNARGKSYGETEYARWYSDNDKTPTKYITPCLNGYHWNTNTNPQTVVIQRDVWEDWQERWDWDTNDTINKALSHTDYYPNDILTNPNPPLLGMAFCSWVPTEEDIMTANNTEIELYYFMLDNDSYIDPNKKPKLEVKTERISLKRDHSITTNISPIK